MAYGLVGLYAVYLIFVGIKGNAKTLIDSVGSDAKGFSAWVLAIVILKALNESDTLKPVVKPFIGLAVLAFTLKNYNVIVEQVNEITGLKLPESR